MEKINRENMKFEFDPISESVIETVTEETVYRETGIGEIDLRNVMNGEEFWHGCHQKGCTDPKCGADENGNRTPFTFDDFVSEIVIPDLEAQNAFAGRGGKQWKSRTSETPTMQQLRIQGNQGNDELVDFVMQSNDIGMDDDDYIFDDEGGYFESMDTLIEEMEYRHGCLS